MKKLYLVLVLIITTGISANSFDWPYIIPVAGQPQAPVVINEYELNPEGDDSTKEEEPDKTGSAKGEWVELLNRLDGSVDISGWSIESTQGYSYKFIFPTGTILTPKGYLIVVRPDGKRWLNNEDETIILRNTTGNQVDRTHPSLKDDKNDSRTWQRCPNGKDTDQDIDWLFGASSNGVPNNCP